MALLDGFSNRGIPPPSEWQSWVIN